ncbi:MAG: septal ring lytic transglycosylase RlpA family protein [Sinimarinibacterium flocculans]|uniref:septal ring lytic transglycosylase RlpA family protein n=1 Tax=Sinimarinibacterium flocculans TaxID=985250 RepID=UPI003C4C10A2
MRLPARAIALLLMLGLAGCGAPAPKSRPAARSDNPNAGRYALEHDVAPHPDEVPDDIANIPDAVPRAEPRSRGGNSPVYSVFGKTYRVLSDARGFRERGIASWYGKKFHGNRTANGETYDMFRMTAAHKTLPLPSYVRVTRLDNGRSVVVRINDRGPFHKGRVIDLSYAAAAKLDMLGHGSTEVEVVAIDPLEPASPTESWLQIAAYSDPINAVVMREELARHGHRDAQILIDDGEDQPVHRVVLGPFVDTRSAETARLRLQAAGFAATWMRQ